MAPEFWNQGHLAHHLLELILFPHAPQPLTTCHPPFGGTGLRPLQTGTRRTEGTNGTEASVGNQEGGGKSREASGSKWQEGLGFVENARIWPARVPHFNSVT